MYQVIGKQMIDYKNKDGKEIKGMKLFVASDKKGVEGVFAESVFVSSTKMEQCGITFESIKVDDIISIYYNRYGNVETIAVS